MRTVYVNGNCVPENEAKISVVDRGFYLQMLYTKSHLQLAAS